MKRFFLALLSLKLLVGVSAAAAPADDDDLLLMTVPVIAAASKPATGPLGEIQKLAGDWYFDVHADPVRTDEFRFYKNTIAKEDAVTYSIEGDQFLDDFRFIYVDEVGAGYDSQQKVYAVISLWGPPKYDLGSAYVFKSADKNTPGFDCHYFTDGQGNIQNYYIGFGGSVACDPLTKRKRFGKLKRSNPETDPATLQAAMWERHQMNLRANRSNNRKAVPVSSEKSALQALVGSVYRHFISRKGGK